MSFTPLSDSEPIAKKCHICEWCGQWIETGVKYYRYSGIKDAMERDIEEDRYDYAFDARMNPRGKTINEEENHDDQEDHAV